MYSCIKTVIFSKEGFQDIFCREMYDDVSYATDVQIRGGKSNHSQSGYFWNTLKGEELKTYEKWVLNAPDDVLVKITTFSS